MSRGGAGRSGGREEPTGGTPVWVWLVYGLGILGATIVVASGLFVLGAYLGSEEGAFSLNVSLPVLVLWGGLALAALVLRVRRRTGGRR
ncbi:MAG: hypothetical protein RMM28_01605 [Thermoleophilia bacterium]|nr:hypothetical protein [Gaiellaceae bacterium]MDW8337821.1 hypothetical protein [Thermoleophilia bacterium]